MLFPYHRLMPSLSGSDHRTVTVSEEYARQWRRYRIMRYLFWILFLGLFFILESANRLSMRFFGEYGPAFLVMLVWVSCCVLAAVLLGRWRCPRCGRIVAQESHWKHKLIFARQCVHCGFPKHADAP
jgi:hypothetical protein